MNRNQIAQVDQVRRAYENLSPEQRKKLNDDLGLVFQSPVEKAMDAYEYFTSVMDTLTDEEREEFEKWEEEEDREEGGDSVRGDGDRAEDKEDEDERGDGFADD